MTSFGICVTCAKVMISHRIGTKSKNHSNSPVCQKYNNILISFAVYRHLKWLNKNNHVSPSEFTSVPESFCTLYNWLNLTYYVIHKINIMKKLHIVSLHGCRFCLQTWESTQAFLSVTWGFKCLMSVSFNTLSLWAFMHVTSLIPLLHNQTIETCTMSN